MQIDSAQQLAQLCDDFARSLPQKAHQISELWKHLSLQKSSERGFKSLTQMVQRLAGAGSSFGFVEVSACASALDAYLRANSSHSVPQLSFDFAHANLLVNALLDQLAQGQTSDNQSHPISLVQSIEVAKPSNQKKLIFLIDNDYPLCALTTLQLRSAAYDVHHFETLQECLLQLDLQMPDAILIDPEILDDSAFETLVMLKTQLPQTVPVMVLSARSDLYARFKVLRCGCECYMTKPLNYDALVESVNRIIRNNEISYRVMVVDDEPLVADYHAAILKHAGMETVCVSAPLQGLQIAQDFLPDLVLLDMHMPDMNGMELAKLLRQDGKFLLTPMIFVTADTSPKLHQSIQSLGVNGVLTKPVEMSSLISVCKRAINDTFSLKQRIERVTQKAAYKNQITRSYFFAAVEHEISEYHTTTADERFSAIYYIGFKIPEDLQSNVSATELMNLRAQFSLLLASLVTEDEPWADLSNMIACVLAGRKTADQHQDRAQELQQILSEHLFSLKEQTLKLDAYIGGCELTDKLSSAKIALELAERAFDQAFFDDQDTQTAEPLNLPPAQFPETKTTTPTINDPLRESTQSLTSTSSASNFSTSLPLDNLGLFYQPMISFEQAEVGHYEALVRWQSADNEIIPAAIFLKYVQHSTMRIELDRWVLQSTVSAITRNRYTRENVSLFVHLASETLSQNTFFSFAANLLHTSRLRGDGRLIFIFEEAWVKENLEVATSVLVALHNIRCCVCLSHAGSTDQTISILQTLRFDYVRIEPELTSNLGKDSIKDSHLTQIIEQAKASHSQIIATHVEDSKNLSTLWLQGVRLFQGFVLQPPEQTFKTQDEQDVMRNIASTYSPSAF